MVNQVMEKTSTTRVRSDLPMIESLMEKKVSILKQYPRFEGSNIVTFIGFKHVMYLSEEALLQRFRNYGLLPRMLFENYGICLEIVDSNHRILHALHMDELIETQIEPVSGLDETELRFKVTMLAQRDGKTVKLCTGKISALFRFHEGDKERCEIPENLKSHVVECVDRSKTQQFAEFDPKCGRGDSILKEDLLNQVVPSDANTFIWKWHIPYIYCHFTHRLQMSGYLRLMEEVEDLFLADRGISIYTYLTEREWIPVVPSANVEILREAKMEETIYTVYTLEDVFRDVTYTHRMDCYVIRGNELIKTATGKITHGYAKIQDRKEWRLVNFDERTIDALNNKK